MTKIKLQNFRAEQKNSKPVIKWNIETLTDLPVVERARVLEITHWAYRKFLNQKLLDKYKQLTEFEKNSLTKRAHIFSSQFENLVISVLSNIKKNDEVLVIGAEADILKELVRDEINPRQIHTSSLMTFDAQLSDQYDSIILVWDDIQSRSEHEIKQLIDKLHKVIKPSGYLTIIAPFAHDAISNTRFAENDLAIYAFEILKNGSPVSEKELALELIARMQHVEQVDSGWLKYSVLTNILYNVGFRSGKGFGTSNEVYVGGSMTWLKPKESDR